MGAGTSEYKFSRGFEPSLVHSVHWMLTSTLTLTLTPTLSLTLSLPLTLTLTRRAAAHGGRGSAARQPLGRLELVRVKGLELGVGVG